MEWRPIRTSALLFGIMLMVCIKVVIGFMWLANPFEGDPQSIMTVLIAIIGAITVFGVAITKLSEDSPAPAPTVPADQHARALEIIESLSKG